MAVFYLTGEESAVTLLGFSISPEFFGDKSGHLVKALQEIGVKHITFVGTAGGLLGDSKVGDIMIPRRLKNFSTGSMGKSELPNAASRLMGEFAETDKVTHDSFRSEDLHVGVHSPITESQEMINAMKEGDVSSVDCEAGFIADALQGSKVSLYALFFVGDVPGTHESIGMGGVSGEVGGEEPKEDQAAPTEQAILYIIQKIIGREISKAQKEIEQSPYPLAGKEITGLTVLGGTPGKGKLVLDAKLPKTAKTGEAFTGVLKTFHKKLAAILEEAGGVVDGKVQGKIFQLVQSFRETHGILILIDYDQG